MQVHHACKRMTLRPSNFAFEPDTRPTDNVCLLYTSNHREVEKNGLGITVKLLAPMPAQILLPVAYNIDVYKRQVEGLGRVQLC